MESQNKTKLKEAKIEVFGRVQGVLFRNNIKNFADRNGLKGYAENKADGSVIIVAQGDAAKINSLIEWAKSSPGLTKVSGVRFEFREVGEKYEEFKIMQEGGLISDKSKALVNLGKHFLGEDLENVPVHVAIIPDGNRRWAREKGMIATAGHYAAGSYGNIESIFNEGRKLGIKFMSIWAFSTENWNRDKKEIDAVFDVLMKGIERFRKDAHKNQIRFRHIGRKDRLPKNLASEITKLEEETKNYDEFNVQLCLDYGGRDEIIRAVNKLIKEGGKKVDEQAIASYLDTAGIPDVDMIIRTSGEKRLSGFMPFQSDYAELFFFDKYWPDFNPEDLKRAVSDYSRRVRRFGGTSKKDLEGKKENK